MLVMPQKLAKCLRRITFNNPLIGTVKLAAQTITILDEKFANKSISRKSAQLIMQFLGINRGCF